MNNSKMVRGGAAIHLAQAHGVALMVFNLQKGWIPGGVGVLSRAIRSDPRATYIYGADMAAVTNEQRCACCP